MTRLLSCDTRLEAWTRAVHHLLAERQELNLILSIDNPLSDGGQSKEARRLVDAFLVSEGQHPLHAIAETIFPAWEYRHRGLQGVFETYPDDEFPNLDTRWGTYAQRMLRHVGPNDEPINQIENLINKMRSERSNPGPKTACYELSVAAPEYDLSTYNAHKDGKLRLGLPCLSHLSFKLFHKRVHLAATYRSHDYRFKALGNMLGLARLQACVAKEVGATPGELLIHSTYAWLHQGSGKKALRELVGQLDQLTSTEADA